MSYFFRAALMKAVRGKRRERGFFGATQLDVKHLRLMPRSEAEAKWPGAKFRTEGVPAGEVVLAWSPTDNDFRPLERVVNYKVEGASRHECGAACQNAKGQHCECVCEGAQHGINT
jgi:hypothetical protein